MENAFLIIIAVIVVFVIYIIAKANSSEKTEKWWSSDYGRFSEAGKRRRERLETVTKLDRGTSSERDLVLKLLDYGIPAQIIFHDLYLRRRSGNHSQIDLVVPTTAGIVVFEVKDYSGWIYGNGNSSQWTQVLSFGKQKYRFYNPIKQNYSKIRELRNLIGNVPFFSVVVFSGNCQLKDITFVPEGTFVVREERVLEVMRIIQSKEPAPYTDKHKVVRILREAVENGVCETIEVKHAEKVTDLLGKHRVFD
jgi:hypothetical protein